MSEQDDSDIGDDWAAAMNEQAESEAETKGAKNSNHVEMASFDRFDNQPHGAGEMGETGNEIQMDIILDIPVTMSMEIGRTQVSIRILLQWNEGSVVELDRLAGEPMDVLVNGTLIAHGEVVVVNDKFGIRLTDVVSPTERVKKLS